MNAKVAVHLGVQQSCTTCVQQSSEVYNKFVVHECTIPLSAPW